MFFIYQVSQKVQELLVERALQFGLILDDISLVSGFALDWFTQLCQVLKTWLLCF